MKFELWQIFVYVTSFVIILGVMTATRVPLDQRLGLLIVLGGLLISFGRPTFPRPKLRDYVANDRQLQRWSDIIAFGLPASFLVWIGSTTLLARSLYLFSVGYGILIAVIFYAVYCLWVFTQD